MGEIKKGGEEFFSKKIRGAKTFFQLKKGGEDFFLEKIRGAKNFFWQIFPKTRTRYPINFDRSLNISRLTLFFQPFLCIKVKKDGLWISMGFYIYRVHKIMK